jgi:hypothetical protein
MCDDKVIDHYFDDELGRSSCVCVCVGKYDTQLYPRIYVPNTGSVRAKRE